jgi:hypothetical protein
MRFSGIGTRFSGTEGASARLIDVNMIEMIQVMQNA